MKRMNINQVNEILEREEDLPVEENKRSEKEDSYIKEYMWKELLKDLKHNTRREISVGDEIIEVKILDVALNLLVCMPVGTANYKIVSYEGFVGEESSCPSEIFNEIDNLKGVYYEGNHELRYLFRRLSSDEDMYKALEEEHIKYLSKKSLSSTLPDWAFED